MNTHVVDDSWLSTCELFFPPSVGGASSRFCFCTNFRGEFLMVSSTYLSIPFAVLDLEMTALSNKILRGNQGCAVKCPQKMTFEDENHRP